MGESYCLRFFFSLSLSLSLSLSSFLFSFLLPMLSSLFLSVSGAAASVICCCCCCCCDVEKRGFSIPKHGEIAAGRWHLSRSRERKWKTRAKFTFIRLREVVVFFSRWFLFHFSFFFFFFFFWWNFFWMQFRVLLALAVQESESERCSLMRLWCDIFFF